MKNWRRPSLAIVALMALFAPLLPQVAWACPLTGRVDSPSLVCQGALPMAAAPMVEAPVAGKMPCAQLGGHCCKPLAVPGPWGSDGKSPLTLNVVASVDAVALTAPQHTSSQTLMVVAAEAPQTAPALRVWLTRFTNSPPVRSSRYRPAALAGRAPPVL